MKAWLQKLNWYFQYVALRVVEMLLQCFPIEDNLRTARWAGDLRCDGWNRC